MNLIAFFAKVAAKVPATIQEPAKLTNNMKKIANYTGLLVALFGTSCTSLMTPDQFEVTDVNIRVEDFEYEPDTKASIALEDNSFQFYWLDSDEVGIFPNKGGYQLGFSLQGQGGKKTASFNGGGWALKIGTAYSTYYPFRFENRDPESIPVSYLGQKQTGNNSLSHIGPYFYCATEPTEAIDGTVVFVLNNIGAVVWFALTVPDPGTYTEVALVTDEKLFTTDGSYDLKNYDLSIVPTKRDKKMTLALDNVKTTSENEVINAYMMVAPFDLTGHSYKVYLRSSAGIYYSADLASKSHVLNRNGARKVSATVELSDGYNMGIGDWGDGGNVGGDAQ